MRLSELSASSGVSVPTVKYYLREGLLPPGASSLGRAATYDERHLSRLRLIRALLDSAGLSIAATREIVAALERQGVGWHELLGTAQYAISGPRPVPSAGSIAGQPSVSRASDVSAHLADWGWQVSARSPARAELAAALDALRRAEVHFSTQDLGHYAAAMHTVAEVDVSTIPRSSPEAALRQVVLGTVLLDPVLLAMRKLAQEDVSSSAMPAARPPRPPHRR